MAKKLVMIHAPCNRCNVSTRHSVQASIKKALKGDDGEWVATVEHSLIECAGCETVTMKEAFSHDVMDEEMITYFPPRVSRKKPDWIRDLPRDLHNLMTEIYPALHSNSRRLAMMGARTIVDLFMNATIGDIGGFAQKKERLIDEGYISKRDAEILDAALNAGHAASHRAHRPTAENLNAVMDIVENMIQKLVLTRSAQALSESTPVRKSRKKKSNVGEPSAE